MGATEAGCLAHARRKFYKLWTHHQAPWPKHFGRLYDMEREPRSLDVAERRRRQCEAKPAVDLLHEFSKQRSLVRIVSATAKAIDYSLGALGRARALRG